MFGFIEFFDAAFVRLLWALVVDYLVSSGYLLPTQRQQWVDGYVHILSAAGAIIFVAIWMHHSNKKETAKALQTATTTATAGVLTRLLSGFKNFVFKENTTTVIEPATTTLPTEEATQI